MEHKQANISNYIIYGDDTEELAPNFVHFERMEESKRKHQGDIKPHIHSNLFQFYLIENGSLAFSSNEINTTIAAGSIVLIPENTLHGVQLHDDIKGAVLTLSQPMLERIFEHHPSLFNSINQLQFHRVTTNLDFIRSLVNKIEYESLHRNDPQDQVIGSLLTILFTDIYRDIQKGQKATGGIPFDHGHFSKFRQLIKRYGSVEKTLQDYANEIGITSTHLNRICKAAVGKRASEFIRDFIILESKRHLKFSTYTISEIAYLLEFSDPSYFNRYFKREVGLTPRAYRLS